MRTHLIMIVGLLGVSATAAAEPQKAVVSRPGLQPTKIVLASADPVRTPNSANSAPTPAKRPVGRVTTCRCGNPAPAADSPDQ